MPCHVRPKAMSLARRFEPRRTARRSQREFHASWNGATSKEKMFQPCALGISHDEQKN